MKGSFLNVPIVVILFVAMIVAPIVILQIVFQRTNYNKLESMDQKMEAWIIAQPTPTPTITPTPAKSNPKFIESNTGVELQPTVKPTKAPKATPSAALTE